MEILRFELNTENEKIEIPDFLKVIEDITGLFSN